MVSSPEQTKKADYNLKTDKQSLLQLRRVLILLGVIIFISFWAYQIDITLPKTPSINNTYRPLTQPTAQEIGSYDVLGKMVNQDVAASLLKTDAGKQILRESNGTVAITEDLIQQGRNAFYTETFGNEYFINDVTGILNGPLNIGNLAKAIASLDCQHTTNLQVSLDRDMTVGNQTFKKGDILNTGLDVLVGSLFPLGVITRINHGKIRIDITYAACHTSVDRGSGRILEGAPNNDLNTKSQCQPQSACRSQLT